MSSPLPDIVSTFAARLRAARIAAHLSQTELAAQLGVAVRTLQGWEAGTFPQPKHRRKVVAFIAEVEDGQAA